MKPKFDDAEKVVLWPKEHWHVALFVLAVVAFAASVLVELHVLTTRAAVAGTLGSAVYVLLTTWRFTRGDHPNRRAP